MCLDGVDGSRIGCNVIVRDPPSVSGNEMETVIQVLSSYIHINKDYRCTGAVRSSRT